MFTSTCPTLLLCAVLVSSLRTRYQVSRHQSGPQVGLYLCFTSKTGTIAQYAKSCDNNIVHPLLGKDYSCIEVNGDIHAVCGKLIDAANSLIQRRKVKMGGRLKDRVVSSLLKKPMCLSAVEGSRETKIRSRVWAKKAMSKGSKVTLEQVQS